MVSAFAPGTPGLGSHHLVAGRPRAGAGTVRRHAAEDAGTISSRSQHPTCCSAMSLSIRNHLDPVADCNVHSSGDCGRACAGPGVAHLTLPQDVLEAKADGAPFSISTLRPRPEIAGSESDVTEVAHRIVWASSVVIMCGAGCHCSADLLSDVSRPPSCTPSAARIGSPMTIRDGWAVWV